MAKSKKVVLKFIAGNCLILCGNLWSAHDGATHIAQCQASIEAYQSKHQSPTFFHSRQERVKHLLGLLQSKTGDIATRIYLHYLSINDPNSELLQSLEHCLVVFLALEKKDLKNLDLKIINLDFLEKLKALDARETGFWSRFGVEQREFDEAVGLAVEVVKPRSTWVHEAPIEAPKQEPVDLEPIKKEFRKACDVVRNIDHDQHYEGEKRSNTLEIVAHMQSLAGKLGAPEDLFDKLQEFIELYKIRKDSKIFDLVKRAARDICQEVLKEPIGKTPGELLEEMAKLANDFKYQMMKKTRNDFLAFKNREEIQTALGLKREFDAAVKNINAEINLPDLDALKLAHNRVEEYTSLLWLGSAQMEFLSNLAKLKKLLPKTNFASLDAAIKDFSSLPNDENANKAKNQAKKIFVRVNELERKYVKARQSYDSSYQKLVKEFELQEFIDEDADRKYFKQTQAVVYARPGTVKGAKKIADEFVVKAVKSDADIGKKIAAIFEDQIIEGD